MSLKKSIRLALLGVLVSFVSGASGSQTTSTVLSVTAPWRYTATAVDAANWTSPGYNDSAWKGPSNGVFFLESAALPASKSTPLPPQPGGGPMPCYYFRSTFTVTNAAAVVALHFKCLIDDGAAFYLNGVEIQRVRMSAGPLVNTTEAVTTPPDGDATSFESFTVVRGLRTNLVEGVNVLAARLHQHGTESTDAVFGAQVSVIRDSSPVIQLSRGPYLQVCTPTSVVVRWRTDFEEDSLVCVGTSTNALNLNSFNGALDTEHEVAVTNLTPDTRYFFSVGSTARRLAGGDATCAFLTHPRAGQPKPLRIWATGDAGTADENAQAVRDAFEAFNQGAPVDAWLQLGDNAYLEGTDAEYQAAMFDMYASRLRQTPVWTTMANHETYSTDWNGLYPYLNNFTMPTLGEAGGVASHTKLYYSFDVGMVHFVSLDSMISSRASDGDMADWLRADLAANTNRWLIAFFHHPPYTKGSHDSDTEIELIEMRQNILPILEAGGVDLVLNGHSHSYERSFLLNGHYGDSASLTGAMVVNGGSGRTGGGGAGYEKPEHVAGSPIGNQGAVYAVVGCSGKTSGGSLDHPAMFTAFNSLGSLVLDVTTSRIDAFYLRETGATNDWFTIVKNNNAPVASNLACTVAADGSTGLVLSALDVNRNPLFFTITRFPTNGLVSGLNSASGALTYTPAHGTATGDALWFVASDGNMNSATATVAIAVLPPVDTDGDGLPNAWEAKYATSDASADSDRDGATNLQEYRAGTDPTNAASVLKMVEVKQLASGVGMSWASVGGTRYRILYSDGDEQGGFNGVFTPLPRAVGEEMDPHAVGAPGTMSVTDDLLRLGPPAHGCRYFRVSVAP